MSRHTCLQPVYLSAEAAALKAAWLAAEDQPEACRDASAADAEAFMAAETRCLRGPGQGGLSFGSSSMPFWVHGRQMAAVAAEALQLTAGPQSPAAPWSQAAAFGPGDCGLVLAFGTSLLAADGVCLAVCGLAGVRFADLPVTGFWLGGPFDSLGFSSEGVDLPPGP
ncbi:MAG: hypothetical protein FRX49_08799 [Trebouxia sp. A1-2]|nr:MAG: hypothetical protein FRX49_08799 [Trebouxia sp. A1-2]